MIEVNNVSLTIKKYNVLNNISIKVNDGEAIGLVGGNGSGKTMLMKCICGFNTMFSGEIKVSGTAIGKAAEFSPETGFIIETPGFIPYMNGYENLKVLADIRKNISKDTIREYMELVGLNPDDKKSVKKYSLGMRQRLGLAQALMENPSILILDEPLNGLDKEMVMKMREILVAEKKKGKTIILCSHNQQDIDYVCDRIYEIDGGRIVVS